MEIRVGYKGIDQDSISTKRDKDKYWSARNLHIMTDGGDTSLGITNANGHDLSFRIPDTYPVYRIYAPIIGSKFVSLNTRTFTVTASGGVKDLYDDIISDFVIASYIANGYLYVGLRYGYIVVHCISTSINVNSPAAGIVQTVVPALSGLRICGAEFVRNDLVIFTTNSTAETPTNSYGQIWRVKFRADIEEPFYIDPSGYLQHTQCLVFNGQINLSTFNRVGEVKSWLDAEEDGKIYFTDTYNFLRHIDLYSTKTLGLEATELEFVPLTQFSPIKLNNIYGGGLYNVGMIQYAYQLYNLGGATTRFSEPSALIHVTQTSENTAGSRNYIGAPIGTFAGKSFEIDISGVDENYDRIRVVALHYTAANTPPSVNIVAESGITNEMSFFDNGTSLGTLTAEQYVGMGGRLFVAWTIETKDNRLVAGNIKEEMFDVDFDARAYRFLGGNNPVKTKIFKKNDTAGEEYTPAQISAIPQEHDCINKYNTLLQTLSNTNLQYKYQADGTTIGGEGLNVKYSFATTDIVIDTAGSSRAFYVSGTGGNFSVDLQVFPNNSYKNSASPFLNILAQYQRNEVYGFAMVLINGRGQRSFAKWIGDIRMPSVTEPVYGGGAWSNDVNTYRLTQYTAPQIIAKYLHPVFEVSNLPIDPLTGSEYKWMIVRCDRAEKDMRVVSNGVVNPYGFGAIGADTVYKPLRHLAPCNTATVGDDFFATDANGVDAINKKSQALYEFLSPETMFDNGIYFNTNDSLLAVGQYYTQYRNIVDGLTRFGDDNEELLKLFNATGITTNPQNVPCSFGTKIAIGTSNKTNIAGLANQVYNYADYSNAPAPYKQQSYHCTNYVLKPTITFGASIKAGMQPTSYFMCQYLREVPNQYGGNGYFERANRSYIQCSLVRSGNTSATAIMGDTHINMFDLLRLMWVDSVVAPSHKRQEVIFFPVESKINLELRHDQNYNRNSTYKLQETVAIGQAMFPGAYHTTTDLYLYNSVYSRNNNVVKFFPKPLDFEEIVNRDTEIIVSEKKLSNEQEDSWLSFLPNNTNRLEAELGAVNKIISHKEVLYAFQSYGIAVQPINERELMTQTESGAPLVLGSGDVVGRHGYFSRNTGTVHKFSVLSTDNALYYFDARSKKIMSLGGSAMPLSSIAGLHGYFNTNTRGYVTTSDRTMSDKTDYKNIGVHCGYDRFNKRIYWTLTDSYLVRSGGFSYYEPFRTTVSYSEFLQSFESFFDFYPALYVNLGGRVFAVDQDDKTRVYKTGSGEKGVYFGSATPQPMVLNHLVSGNDTTVKIFDQVRWHSMSSTTAGVDNDTDTFSSIRVYNEHQNSGVIPLNDDDNLRRTLRTWYTSLFNDNDELSPTHNPLLESEARIRSEAAHFEFTYNNANNNTLTVHDLTILMRNGNF